MEQESKELVSPDQLAQLASKQAEQFDKQALGIKIKNDDDLTTATDMLAKIKATSKNIKAQKDPIIKDLNSSVKRIRDLFKPAETWLDSAEKTIKAQILEYHTKQEAKANKKIAKIEEKINNGELEYKQGVQKLSGVKQAPTTVQGAAGGVQVKTIRKVVITDVSQLPPAYLFRERVIEALRLEVSEDVMKLKKPCPTGAEVVEERMVASV